MVAVLVARQILQRLCIGLAVLLLPISLYAVCGTAPDGQIEWTGSALRYCSNSVWRTVNGINRGTACAPNGTIQYNSGALELRFCKAGTWWHVGGDGIVFQPGDGPACTAGAPWAAVTAGYFYYDTTRHFFVYCSGTPGVWRDFW